MANGLIHSAERIAFGKLIDRVLQKSENQSVQETFGPLLEKVKKIMGDGWSDKAYEDLQSIIDNIQKILWMLMTTRIILQLVMVDMILAIHTLNSVLLKFLVSNSMKKYL